MNHHAYYIIFWNIIIYRVPRCVWISSSILRLYCIFVLFAVNRVLYSYCTNIYHYNIIQYYYKSPQIALVLAKIVILSRDTASRLIVPNFSPKFFVIYIQHFNTLVCVNTVMQCNVCVYNVYTRFILVYIYVQ